MELQKFLAYMNAGEKVSGGSEAHQYMVKLAFEAMKVTAVLNQGYHEPEEIFVITKLYPNQFANAKPLTKRLTSWILNISI